MLKLCRVDIERSEEVFERIEKYKEAVVKRLSPEAVILFGSFARGDINEGSDVDIAVIADFEEPFLDRIKLLLELNEGIGLPLEPIGYTPEEFRRMLREGNRFALEIAERGRLLYGGIPGVEKHRPQRRVGLHRG